MSISSLSLTIQQCEHISTETGCWLYLAAQHPNARLPFVHYSSPRFRRDAMAQVTEITNQFHAILSGLVRARYLSAMELQNKLNSANKTASEAKTALRIAEEALENKQKELNAILTMFQISLAPR